MEVVKICTPGQPLPVQWKKFLGVGIGENLISFICSSWKQVSPSVFKDVKVYITHKEECYAMYAVDGVAKSEPVAERQSDHEEVDTRMLLHCSFISSHA